MEPIVDGDIREFITSLFQADELLSAQYYERNKKDETIPEKVLMLAILEDAVCCFQKYVVARDRKEKKLFSEAKHWIFDDDWIWVFLYRNVCEFLGIDGNYLRWGLLRWQERNLSFRARKVCKVRKQLRTGELW